MTEGLVIKDLSEASGRAEKPSSLRQLAGEQEVGVVRPDIRFTLTVAEFV
jgi:hypothetical protein